MARRRPSAASRSYLATSNTASVRATGSWRSPGAAGGRSETSGTSPVAPCRELNSAPPVATACRAAVVGVLMDAAPELRRAAAKASAVQCATRWASRAFKKQIEPNTAKPGWAAVQVLRERRNKMIAILRQEIFECCREVIVDDRVDQSRRSTNRSRTTHVVFNEPVSLFTDGGVLDPIQHLCLKP